MSSSGPAVGQLHSLATRQDGYFTAEQALELGFDSAMMRFCAIGTFSERSVIPAGSAVKIGEDAPLDTVCLIGCGVTTGVGAAVNTSGRLVVEATAVGSD